MARRQAEQAAARLALENQQAQAAARSANEQAARESVARQRAEIAEREASERRVAERNAAIVRQANNRPSPSYQRSQPSQPSEQQQSSPAATVSPQAFCSTKSNFISKALCESRECLKPEHVNSAYCKAFQARSAAAERYRQ